MPDIYDDLADALSETMIGLPYDVKSTHPERYRIDALVEMVEDYGFADVPLATVQTAFAPTGFDITQWLDERTQSGDFASPEPETMNAP